MDSLFSLDISEPPVSQHTDPLPLACPDCGNPLELPEDAISLSCTWCGEDHLVVVSDEQVRLLPLIPGVGGRQAEGDWRIPALTIYQLRTQVNDLEKQLGRLTRHGSLIDLARNAGFTAMVAGFGYSILHSAANLPALPYGLAGLLSGIFLHGSSRLFGRQYFAQKAVLRGQIRKKQIEIEHNQEILSSLES